MEHAQNSPDIQTLPAAVRHDGWNGEKMAVFCEALAETAVVAEACDKARMGVSGAYALRRRRPIFAAAWDAALTIARERLADTLLARAIEGNVEQIYKDGVLIGERHVIDNRLGLAILRRLDRLAETGMTVSTRGEPAPISVRAERSRSAPAPRPQSFDWELAIDALRTGNEDAVASALALAKGYEVEEVEDPPVSLIDADTQGTPKEIDLTDRCWKEEDEWVTDFPPPPGFDGWQSGQWGDRNYQRACTAEEAAILEADLAADIADELSEEEELRDAWFAMLRGELSDEAGDEEEAEPECAGSEPDGNPRIGLDVGSLAGKAEADAGVELEIAGDGVGQSGVGGCLLDGP